MVEKDQQYFGYYEKRLCILIFLSSIPNAFATFFVVVTQYKPPHNCGLEGLRKDLTTMVMSVLRNALQFLS